MGQFTWPIYTKVIGIVKYRKGAVFLQTHEHKGTVILCHLSFANHVQRVTGYPANRWVARIVAFFISEGTAEMRFFIRYSKRVVEFAD